MSAQVEEHNAKSGGPEDIALGFEHGMVCARPMDEHDRNARTSSIGVSEHTTIATKTSV
ncbi:hypothetical protein [Mycobacteroides chelonae]|jgi:hypothetical protein|uniref:hypothetical protein n=1 Tax=Mycobacteroides chelonae TaxID=1774 RepID=UPI000A62258C|nr:hypothetical protein [Mycobacteroides chelonae]MEC4836369.1 hypothetical protein [Mycobacteroides chelonae]MEC4838451.1 hypothetical protein [Mycobacteroides chelonae]MEC4845456.1 hypothetical protein [Mycobacteroides chelonae]MEC4854622.1 hypothetical protein [Mycobacteroides chelonae]MEC4869513.1 hypothetical protein [Mycobacteroides chelonae]